MPKWDSTFQKTRTAGEYKPIRTGPFESLPIACVHRRFSFGDRRSRTCSIHAGHLLLHGPGICLIVFPFSMNCTALYFPFGIDTIKGQAKVALPLVSDTAV